ncbi:cob(I)yrinic acid a,c-diamide adenosyltransferase [Swaminathania salitolerans]|uniref:Corrinoid adenosyltransferase n=1 Tax=Swaminathania salitolerans TaxID=182838 RepID=A0A511BQE1_9PROT|nr:cob(I)yrinic acid a,c-diamide adenosyltransferase [Swaminathania salitolerans]GBQ11050.1 cobalamin adenosyltransferase [Swaminathania salitolerans LMG 21291]GEL02282.1 cob(I)yrinic acid a,c-diamide adenosyltransferase [Swaminathania salitolerans]
MSVRLDRIVTRGGDGGETSLADGSRLRKDAAEIEALGTLDELNAAVGLVRLHSCAQSELLKVQNLLFDMGALLCVPDREADAARFADALEWLEGAIVSLREAQSPLTSFVLPGGTEAACRAHMARTVTRRAERRVVAIGEERLGPVVMILNRLSDYFFVLARHENDRGRADVLWQPAQTG